jgi:hypothetical protein
MEKNEMTAMEISEYMHSLKVQDPDLDKIYTNITNMIRKMSSLEVLYRQTRKKSVKNELDRQRQEIFKAIKLYKRYLFMLKLMS